MSTPLQSGPIPGYVQGVLAELKSRGDQVKPGDIFMHNDPYNGASHGPDVGFLVPVFSQDVLVGFSVTTAHHLDIGALTPGSCGIVDAVDAYAEGLQFKAVRVYENNLKVEPVWQILRSNIRMPDLVVGDMEAQVSAAKTGSDRFLSLIKKYGIETISAAYENLLDYSETLMKKSIQEVPDGIYYAETFIDGFLDSEDENLKNIKIAVSINIAGSKLKVDLAGTSKQINNKPINMPFVGTVDCAIWLTLRSILLDSNEFGAIPQNSGLTRPIEIVAPLGSLANPIFPAPVIARFCPGNAVADTVMKAMSQAIPEKVSAGIGNLRVVAFSGGRAEQQWVHMEIMEGSYGGRFGQDGMDSVDTLYANTRNNPIEDIESHLPLRVLKYELRAADAGHGKWRGGLGTIRMFEFLDDGAISIEGDGHKYAPWGLNGGSPGSTAEINLLEDSANKVSLPSKIPYMPLLSGTKIEVLGPNGGGYGPRSERDPKMVRADLDNEIITSKIAEEEYNITL
jgi:N-methylhydantoinase B